MNEEQLKNLLRSYGLKPNFTYGQNFLTDDIVLQDMVDAAEISKTDFVLEIGPGIANLTKFLCERAAFVLSVEKDPKFVPILKALKKDFKENFRYEISDALSFNFMEIFKTRVENQNQKIKYKVVANIPYYITGKILKMFLTSNHKPESITVLTQKEVAQSVVSGPGDLSILAISVQIFGQPKIISIVPGKSFYPAPKVDSAVLKIDLYAEPKYKISDEKKFFGLLKACFSGKRKQIHNTLVSNLHLEKERVEEILESLKIPKTFRPQQLSIDQWIELYHSVEKNN